MHRSCGVVRCGVVCIVRVDALRNAVGFVALVACCVRPVAFAGSSNSKRAKPLNADGSVTRRPCPFYKRIEGTEFIVDGFAHDAGRCP